MAGCVCEAVSPVVWLHAACPIYDPFHEFHGFFDCYLFVTWNDSSLGTLYRKLSEVKVTKSLVGLK